MQETQVVLSLGRKDPLKKEMATYSSILAWRIPGTEEPGGLQSMGLQRVEHNLVTEHAYMCTHVRRAHTHTRLAKFNRELSLDKLGCFPNNTQRFNGRIEAGAQSVCPMFLFPYHLDMLRMLH